ncbi:Na+/H+ antiporter subunit E [Candidatus Macondimonas diazotrophica]|jgi:multicomponent Na+:H+ antiporter subunit E|uniref:Cation transporter n=1 Tax=Candidatus Macondimonas diazotrophica TaxID=2305248 RepID=A0A4Z0FCN6_9GAMM|nr:Na+/H+ antiporter subunit E [Candidatus Macondimonas diazotrophica]NCU00694.1 Na+/H+ antiporter subunit E [Candidatus Macondimonas diazotrophica]TFZ83516.1 cation transporter [Candidatus Macondimonas diazotrophica]HBG29904.1 cation transporter [Gammaproteobacteria bacterium]
MAKAVASLLSLAMLWLLLSGHADALLLSLGGLSVLLVWLLSRRMPDDNRIIRPGFGAARYLGWLLKEIILSNLQVSREILRPTLAITPTLARVPATQTTPLGRTVYANSITLTPGTVSIDVDHQDILIHALIREAAESLIEGDMDRRVTALES